MPQDDVVACYVGIGWREGRCAIGKCTYTAEAESYHDARAMMAEHRQEKHTKGSKPATKETRRLL